MTETLMPEARARTILAALVRSQVERGQPTPLELMTAYVEEEVRCRAEAVEQARREEREKYIALADEWTAK